MFGKLISVEADDDVGGCYSCGGGYSEPKVTILEGLGSMVQKYASEIAGNAGAMKLLLENEQFVKALDQRGFRNVKMIEDLEEKVKLEKRFYLYRDSYNIRELDLGNLPRYAGEELAGEKSILLQSVAKSSLKEIAPVAYKAMCEAKKRIKSANEAKTVKAAERAAKKKQKEIEDARKLLEEAGDPFVEGIMNRK